MSDIENFARVQRLASMIHIGVITERFESAIRDTAGICLSLQKDIEMKTADEETAQPLMDELDKMVAKLHEMKCNYMAYLTKKTEEKE